MDLLPKMLKQLRAEKDALDEVAVSLENLRVQQNMPVAKSGTRKVERSPSKTVARTGRPARKSS